MEDTFIKISRGDANGDKVYRLEPMKKNIIENFLYASENMLLMAKGNVGVD